MTTKNGCRGGIRQWTKQRKRRYLDKDGLGGDGTAVIGRAMTSKREAVTNYCRLRGRKGVGRWWNDKIGRVEGAECPKCGEEEQTPDHIVFRCGKVRRVKDEKGRRYWARENGLRWDSWDALASRKWVRKEDSGGVDGGVLRGCPPSDLKVHVFSRRKRGWCVY